MREADRLTVPHQLRLQLPQHDVRLLPHQPAHSLPIDPAGGPALRSACRRAGLAQRCRDLPGPTDAHSEPLRQLPQRALARSMGFQQLPAQIVTVRTSHLHRWQHKQRPAKYLTLYLREKCSRQRKTPAGSAGRRPQNSIRNYEAVGAAAAGASAFVFTGAGACTSAFLLGARIACRVVPSMRGMNSTVPASPMSRIRRLIIL